MRIKVIKDRESIFLETAELKEEPKNGKKRVNPATKEDINLDDIMKVRYRRRSR